MKVRDGFGFVSQIFGNFYQLNCKSFLTSNLACFLSSRVVESKAHKEPIDKDHQPAGLKYLPRIEMGGKLSKQTSLVIAFFVSTRKEI
jgi:hypothetical protein